MLEIQRLIILRGVDQIRRSVRTTVVERPGNLVGCQCRNQQRQSDPRAVMAVDVDKGQWQRRCAVTRHPSDGLQKADGEQAGDEPKEECDNDGLETDAQLLLDAAIDGLVDLGVHGEDPRRLAQSNF